jgi:hypothetical protein
MTTQQPENKKKKLGLIIGLAIGILLWQFAFKAPSMDKQLMQMASEMNKLCPITVDKETQLLNTTALPNNEFQYNYKLVNTEITTVDIKKAKDNLTPTILNLIKTNPDLKPFRDNKTTLSYNYSDKNGAFLFKLSFTPEQYKD